MPALLALLLAAQVPFSLPDEVRTRYRETVTTLRQSAYFPAARYDDADRKLAGGGDTAALREFIQLGYDHDNGNAILRMVLGDLESGGAPAAAALPAEIEVERYQLKDGRILIGCGGSLTRHFRNLTEAQLAGQRTLDPNLGIDGIANLWIAPADVTKRDRTKVPLPKALPLRIHSRRLEERRRLVLKGEWIRAGKPAATEEIALEAESVGSGGTLFVNAELGLRCLHATADFPELAAAAALPEGFLKLPDRAPRPPSPEAFLARVAELRAKAPEVPWPEPFDPDPAAAAEAAKRNDLVDGDPALSLLRIRFALCYGGDLPELALKDPRAMLDAELSVREALDGHPPESAFKLDSKLVAAIVRHGLSPAPPPESFDDAIVRIPTAWSPWRRWPLLVALHGQGGGPRDMVHFWGALADRAGFVLLCPRHGSPDGTRREHSVDREVLDAVRVLALRGDIDPDRICLTGLSMGGATTWNLATAYPGTWACASPAIRGPSMFDGKALLVRNLKTLPFFALEGEFDGLNTINSRLAVRELEAMKAPVLYHEAKYFGHDALSWLHSDVLAWMAAQSRPSHPATLEHEAMHGYRGARDWIAIRTISQSVAWNAKDGRFSTADTTSLRAELKEDAITVTPLLGKPREVEVYFDDRIMPAALKVNGKAWKPKPSTKKLLERVLATGDRERLYADSTVIKF